VLAAIMVLAAGMVSAVLAASTAVGSTPSRIAIIGDSYTAGSGEGGNGPRSWPELATVLLTRQGIEVDADVAAEGGAGYGLRGSRGSAFEDLTAQAVRRNDDLIVFFGSRNDQPVDPQKFSSLAADTFHLARFAAPAAKVLVIGPPWPTASPPSAVLKIRDSLREQAAAVGAVFVDPITEGWFVGQPDLIGQDGVHPNDAGHVYMAEKIAPLIYDQLTIRV
jgi:lysophospholipase L1-like esterase